jgi:uncharacterized membrane protein (UPF0182 family)
MVKVKRIIFLLMVITIVLLLGYVAFYFLFLDLFVDFWWFKSLKLENYFWLRTFYRYFFSIGVTVFFFGVFFVNFWAASRYLGIDAEEEGVLDSSQRKRLYQIVRWFRTGSLALFTPISLIMAFVLAIPFYEHWEYATLFFFGSASGIVDPIFGNDISFYMFSYPMFTLVQKELLVVSCFILVLVSLQYWLAHHYIPAQKKNYPVGVKLHLSLLLIFLVVHAVWGWLLERFSLLYVDDHLPEFFGLGFVELRYQLPLIWLKIITFVLLVTLVATYFFSKSKRSVLPMTSCILFFTVLVGLSLWPVIPDFVSKYFVKPNPVSMERAFMENNIEATLAAYKLDNIHVEEKKLALNPVADIEKWKSQKYLDNVPLWGSELLIDGYRQLQGIRSYYSFPNVDESRYFINDHLTQVNLAARELNLGRLPSDAQTWENKHLRYTHGYGAVVTPTSQDADQPIKWYLHDLSLTSEQGFKIKHPEIYYGEEHYDYAIVPNKLDIVGVSGHTHTHTSTLDYYHGLGGIPLNSLFRKFLFSAYLGDKKTFFSTSVTRKSKLRFRRNIQERVQTVVPFLTLDKDPYLVITDDRLYWILDAYTLSDWYPDSFPINHEFSNEKRQFNYIRNSVKVTVDAYSGQLSLYISDPSDVIVAAYSRAYPGVFKQLDEMPDFLRKQLRYPRELFFLQMAVYVKYHQTQPELFYQQSETLAFSTVEGSQIQPYYITTTFNRCKGQEEFVLVNPMTPVNRDNLSVLAIAGTLSFRENACVDSYEPNLTIYKFHKDSQVNGFAQVNALIDQNTEVSSMFTLWDQHGSKLVKGRMVVLPMGDSILYVQPVYMVADDTKIPQLSRIIASIGNEVVMEKSLILALTQLQRELTGGTETGRAKPNMMRETLSKSKQEIDW